MATLHEANDFFKAQGAVRSAEAGVTKVLNGQVRWWPMFVHYFNEAGDEVGYVTLDFLNFDNYQFRTFSPPRKWAPVFINDLTAWRLI